MRLENLFEKKQTRKTRWIQGGALLAVLCLSLLNFSPAPAFETQDQAIQQEANPARRFPEKAFITPLARGRLTLGFGPTTHPFTKKPFDHKGVDLAAPKGTPIAAPARGEVTEAGYQDARGHYLILAHDKGYTTLYSHLSIILTPKGTRVKKGDIIANVGSSGVSTGPHLHFELHKENAPIDPLTLIRI